MVFKVILSNDLDDCLQKIKKKDLCLHRQIIRKISQIAECDMLSINHFKNLRGNMSECKRVHVGSFVLFFRVEGEAIIFDRLVHHDDAY